LDRDALDPQQRPPERSVRLTVKDGHLVWRR
jgi:hypothetical protein